MADYPRQDQPGEEEQPGTEQARQEGEHFVGERGDRGQHPRQAERLQGRDQPDQPHQPIGQPPQFLADAVAANAGVALEDRHLVDKLGDPPLHRLGDEMGNDEDKDREQHARPPFDELILPILSGRLGLVHLGFPLMRLESP